MCGIKHIKVVRFVITLILLGGYLALFSQETKSNKVEFVISNLPDTQPPRISIVTPEFIRDSMITDSREIDLIGEVKDESAIKFLSINTEMKEVNDLGLFTSRLKLYPGMNRFRLIASDINGMIKEHYLTIEYVPPVITLADKINTDSRYYGLIIGIDNYEDPDIEDLDKPIDDAEKLYRALSGNYSFSTDDIKILKDATRNEIIDALDYLAGVVTSEDNVLIFYAGHGEWDAKANIGYWLPSDAKLSSTANWFRNSALVDYLKQIDSKHTLLITDACFAGSIFKTRGGASNNRREERAFEVLYELPSRNAMTSGTLEEVPDHSYFTNYLIERLNENKETYLSAEQLYFSFRMAVVSNSEVLPQFGEIRNVGDEGGDFIFLKKQ